MTKLNLFYNMNEYEIYSPNIKEAYSIVVDKIKP